jgi:hypothetical protein
LFILYTLLCHTMLPSITQYTTTLRLLPLPHPLPPTERGYLEQNRRYHSPTSQSMSPSAAAVALDLELLKDYSPVKVLPCCLLLCTVITTRLPPYCPSVCDANSSTGSPGFPLFRPDCVLHICHHYLSAANLQPGSWPRGTVHAFIHPELKQHVLSLRHGRHFSILNSFVHCVLCRQHYPADSGGILSVWWLLEV